MSSILTAAIRIIRRKFALFIYISVDGFFNNVQESYTAATPSQTSVEKAN